MKKALILLNRWELPLQLILSLLWVLDRPALFVFFLILPILWMGGYYKNKRFFPVTGLDFPIFLFSLITLFSLFITPDIQESSAKVLGVVLGISIYYALARLGENSQGTFRIKQITISKVMILILMFLSWGTLVAVLGMVGADWFSKYPFITRITDHLPSPITGLPGGGTGFQPNAISGTLTLFTPLCLYLGYALLLKKDQVVIDLFKPLKSPHLKIILIGVILLQGIWWILAQTRGAWLGLASGVLFLVVLTLVPKRKFLAWLIPLIPVILTYSFWFRSINGLGVDLSSLSGSQITETLQFRLQVWDWANNIISNYLFTGVGYNIFRELAPMLYFGSWLGDVAHAHNIWLDIGVTIGIGGILIWMFIWFRNLRSLWEEGTQSPSNPLSYISVGLIAGWYSYFVFGLADTIPLGSKLGLGIFFILGFGQLVIQWSSQSRLRYKS